MSSSYGTRRKVRQQQLFSSSVPSDPETQAEIQDLFNKVKTFLKPVGEEWRIPDPSVALKHPAEDHRHLQELKASLNAVKNQLSDKNIQVWHQHTNSTNRAGKVIAAVRSAANAEICTQAWCKFYEILGTFDLLPKEALQNGELNSVHLCEAPGAFITALNHYMKTNESTRYCDWGWVANTLNPYHEANGGSTTIADDRLIANTLPWWFFGSDNTGNIMLQKHLLDLQVFVSNMRRVDVVTADGSFDCQENPDEQEALVASLHYCEAAAALLLLSPGGSFVLKMFTLYEHSSVCLLYLLNCCFRSVSVFKPATSKAGNSEVYVVCLNYESKEEVETIGENLRLFEGMSTERRQRLDHIRDCVVHEYLQRFQVSFLPRSRWISRNTVSPACCSMSAGRPLGQKKQTGSFNERKELQNLSWRERIGQSCQAALIQSHCTEDRGLGCVLEGPRSSCFVDSWYVVTGAALPAVRNSPFCDLALLNHLNEALQDAAVDWTLVTPCCSCSVACTASILSEAKGLEGSKEKRRCLVFDNRAAWAAAESQADDLVLTFSEEPSFPQRGRILLHDGEPLYQQQLLQCILLALQNLSAGDALLLRVFSALTRVTAAAVFCLHACFRSISFRCPPPSGGVGALLTCIGFCPEAAVPMLPVLSDVQSRIQQLIGGGGDMGDNRTHAGDRQVLQFVPMEELLKGGLTEFLWTMNSEITQQKLHLLLQEAAC
ncbi:PREDICTED: cap-specific mRNA (nucleoside-2'-O-)-methyltransferase 2 isoform X2 [Poecilia mexicana]|uniref:cap-specific mRNA (nucleoside-2'-O-)-methyltransferase 2 isoform X2 n=1 Tax=Poecilia mexicana TaxID=48701 RepID=UPI00072E2B1E|nr:PREDICTED: cap-specific mRNA (nucleoside-2'-O-)-methyltransferase 2 isoform X2 [Poecilia mexicana]